MGCQRGLDMGFKEGMNPLSVFPEDVQPEIGLEQLLQQVHSIGIDGHTCAAAALRLKGQPLPLHCHWPTTQRYMIGSGKTRAQWQLCKSAGWICLTSLFYDNRKWS